MHLTWDNSNTFYRRHCRNPIAASPDFNPQCMNRRTIPSVPPNMQHSISCNQHRGIHLQMRQSCGSSARSRQVNPIAVLRVGAPRRAKQRIPAAIPIWAMLKFGLGCRQCRTFQALLRHLAIGFHAGFCRIVFLCACQGGYFRNKVSLLSFFIIS